MLPSQLLAENFAFYPPEAKRRVSSHVRILRLLPLSFVPLLLRELIVFDWKFPAERRDLDRQFQYLEGLSEDELRQAMAAFSQLRLSPELADTDWVNSPATFSEQLTAHLWATHQIDGFRSAAVDYMMKVGRVAPSEAPTMHRLVIAVVGQGCENNAYPLFTKLQAHGTYFTHVRHENGLRALLAAVQRRALKHSEPYSHWTVDGGSGAAIHEGAVANVSYSELHSARAALQSRMQKTYEGGTFDPEAFRTMLARTRPEEIGLNSSGDAVLNRFQLSLLTEGSGTQIFATTFVQWAAREVLRRAQPLTLLARFTPRQRERPMNELLNESQRKPEFDPAGSLIDADMGAYYTWVNLQRLSGSETSTFLVWFEDHAEALAIGPSIQRGKRIEDAVQLSDLIERVV